MPELKPSRAYHEALRRLGIQNPGEVGFQTPVQLTAHVDDFTHLAPPISVPVVLISVKGNAIVGEHSGLELRAGAKTRGVHLTLVVETNNVAGLAIITQTAADTEGALVTPLCFTGPTPESTIRSIGLVTPLPGDGAFELTSNGIFPTEFFLAPGQRFQVVRQAVNSSATYLVGFREVPTTGPVEP